MIESDDFATLILILKTHWFKDFFFQTKKLFEAFEILSNQEDRDLYDGFGYNGIKAILEEVQKHKKPSMSGILVTCLYSHYSIEEEL